MVLATFSLLAHLLTLHKPKARLLKLDSHSHLPLRHVQKVILTLSSSLAHRRPRSTVQHCLQGQKQIEYQEVEDLGRILKEKSNSNLGGAMFGGFFFDATMRRDVKEIHCQKKPNAKQRNSIK